MKVESESRTVNAKRNIIGALINKIILLLFPFITRTILIYYMGTLYLGLNSLFSSVLQILSLAELGFGSAVVFSMYEPMAYGDVDSVNALLNLYRRIYRIIGSIILVAGLLFMPLLSFVINGDIPNGINIYILYLINLINTSLGYFLFAYKEALLTSSQRSDIISNIGTITSMLSNVFQIIILIWLRNYYIYSIVLPIITIIRSLAINYITKRMYPEYVCSGQLENEQRNILQKQVTGLFIYKISGVFRNSFDSIILSAFLGLNILAKYNNYFYIMSAVTGIMGIITSSITASIGNSIVTENQDKNYRDFQKFQFLYMWIAGWFTVCLFCLYQPFIKLWVGEDLMFDNLIMAVFCIYFFVLKLGDMCFAYRQAVGLWWNDRYRPIIESAANLTLNIILVKSIGVTGVLLSTILCIIVINAFWGSRVLFIHYFTSKKQSSYLLRLIYFGMITFIACLLTKQVCSIITMTGVGELFIRAVICTVISNLVLWLAYHWMPEYQDAMRFLKKVI